MYAVIMAGGQGTRLWPLSRQKKPKQLHPLISDRSLIRDTYERLTPKFSVNKIFVSTTPDYLEDIKKELPEIPVENFIVEPFVMGTAAACGLVTKQISLRDKDAIIAFLPSDHTIKDGKKFLDVLKFAETLCKEHPSKILTIGINPTRPDTGLGYLQLDSQIEREDGLRAFTVKKFVEKPNLERAKEYVASWEYLWNSGMFIWHSATMLRLIAKFLPNTDASLQRIGEAIGTADQDKVLQAEYAKVENTTIDYGIMEKTNDIYIIPADFGWSDIGSWGTLFDILSETYNTNFISRGHHIGIGNENSMVFANDKLIATVGLKDIVVIDTPDALLICNSKQSQDVKELLNKLKDEGKHLYL